MDRSEQPRDGDPVEQPAAGIGHNKPSVADVLADRFEKLLAEVEDLANRANATRGEDGSIVCDSDERRDLLIGLGIEAHKMIKRLDETKLDATKPLRDEVAETNRFFQTVSVRPEKIKEAFARIVGDYDERKRVEAQRRAAAEAEAARREAEQKLQDAATTSSGVLSDVALNEAAAAEHRAKHLEKQALATGAGPTRTEAGTISQRKNWTFRITDASKIDLNQLRPFVGIADIEKAIRAFVKANRDTVALPGVDIFPETKAQLRG